MIKEYLHIVNDVVHTVDNMSYGKLIVVFFGVSVWLVICFPSILEYFK